MDKRQEKQAEKPQQEAVEAPVQEETDTPNQPIKATEPPQEPAQPEEAGRLQNDQVIKLR